MLPLIVGHRGVTESAPENTLVALEQAAAEGATWVEFDVQLLGSGSPVVIHDGTLERTGGDSRALKDLTIEEIGSVGVGGWYDAAYDNEGLPTLAEYLNACEWRGLSANIEIKHDSASAIDTARAVHRTLERQNFPLDLLISSFALDGLREMRALDADIAIGALFEQLPDDWFEQIEGLQATSIHLSHKYLRDQDIKAVDEAGFELMVYSVDNTGLARRLYRRGVRSFCTGMPASLNAAISRLR